MPDRHAADVHCPECRVRLRLRERRFIGTRFPCPDCGTLLTLTELQDGTAKIEKADAVAEPAAVTKGAVPAARERSRPTRAASRRQPQTEPAAPGWWSALLSPVVVSWIVAGVFGVVLLVLSLQPAAAPPVVSVPDPGAVEPEREPQPDDLPDAMKNGPIWLAVPADSSADRLLKLGLRLSEVTQETGEFPRGASPTPGDNADVGWSWLSQLEQQRHPELSGQARTGPRGWSDPQHDRFVRRPVSEFQNPAVRTKVGGQGFPASHFVGLAGVGADAPNLPADHSRAGIFRRHSPTKLEDVTDGLSQTIAVLGIESGFGSWAEGGPATMRPLTAEPYLRGPDGFGTGSADGMAVLMADGSVRQLSAATDPRLMRRLAAMADGLPTDLSVPGEPGDRPSTPPKPETPPPAQPAVAMNPPDNPPVSAIQPDALPQPVPRPDPEQVRAQRLARIEQTRPLPRREMFSFVEDLFDRPIRWSEEELGPLVARLDEPVLLRSEPLTVAELLERLLADTGLELEIAAEEIRVRPVKRQKP